MADYWALSAGDWSNVSNWLTGTSPGEQAGELPGPLDDVYANGRTIVIDIDTQVQTIANVSTLNNLAGGGFRINSGVSLSANILAGTTTCLAFISANPSFCTLYGNVTGGSSSSGFGITNTSSGSLTAYGNVFGGSSSSAFGINNASSGSIIVYGEIKGGSANTAAGANNNSSGNFIIYGNISGQTAPRSYGARNAGTGSMFISGNIRGGNNADNSYGVQNTSTGTITVYGSVSGGPPTAGQPGIRNETSGSIFILGDIYGVTGNGVANMSTGLLSITGNVYGGLNATGAVNNGSGVINIFGNVFGGAGTNIYGAFNSTTGTVNVFGTAKGGPGTNAHGVYNSQNNGNVYVARAVGNDFGVFSFAQEPFAYGAATGLFNNALSGRCYVGEINCGSRGVFPTGGIVWLSGNKNTKAGYSTGEGRVTMIALCANSDYQPRPENVRFDLYYDEINNPEPPFGFLYMPRPNQVANGTLVDNTTGTATFENPEQIWNVSVYDTGLFNRDPDLSTPDGYDYSFGNRLRNSLTLNNLSSIAVSLNNQTRPQ